MKRNGKYGWLAALALLGTLALAGCQKAGGESASGADTKPETVATEAAGQTGAEETALLEETATPAETEPAQPDPLEGLSLKELFAQHGMKVGTCLSTYEINRNSVNQVILDQFNSITMGNDMKPDYILDQKASQEEGQLVVNFNQDAMMMLYWARQNGFSLRGHTLVWYSQTPEWLFHEDFDEQKGYVDREEMLSRMESMIRQVFEKLEEMGYLDLFYAYDVVNEAWMEDGTLRQNHWSEIIGDDYLWYAFFYADQYAPETIDLYYNDYNEQFKAQTISDFVRTLVDEDGRSLIDGIGLQAHLYTSDDLDAYFEAVDTLGETGLKLQLTELDVCLGQYQVPGAPTDQNLRKQGQFYYDLIHGLLERVDAGQIRMDALTFWGLSDAQSWRREYSPMLFDFAMKPKYAYYGAMQVKEQAGFEQ